MTSSFDVEHSRSHFPALQQKQVFFDNAGGSQTLGPVIDSISKYLSNNNVQMGASYAIGQKSTKLYGVGLIAGARYINAEPGEIVISSATTQLFRNLSLAIDWAAGDEIIVSKLDHEANISSWVAIAKRMNLTLKWWTVEPSTNPRLLAEDLKKLLTPKTRLVTCTHASNILGTITDVKAIAETVHTIPGAMLCVDAVAYAPHRAIDVKSLDVDFYCFSWYKVYGPHISMLYGSKAAQKQLLSLGHYFNPSETLEDKLGLAGSNYECTQAIPEIAKYFSGDLLKGVATHEAALAKILLDYLNSRDDVTIYGKTSSDPGLRVPTISFNVKGWGPKELVETVEKQSDFGFRWGHFYSKRLSDEILQLGPEGVVRVSMVHYNTQEEIKSFVEILKKVVVAR